MRHHAIVPPSPNPDRDALTMITMLRTVSL